MSNVKEAKNPVQEASEESFECTQCSARFSYKKTLTRHMRNIHSASGKPVACGLCYSRFNDKWAMTKHVESTHMKKHHVLTCPICHYEDSKVMIDIHFAEQHGIHLEEESHNFDSLEQFEKWKNQIELSTVARFVVNQKFRKKNGAERIIYNCHRSGFFKPRGKNKRSIKSQGTNKIMGFCPARLEFEAKKNGGVAVQFIKTHVGHKNEAEKVFSQLEMKLFHKPPRSVGVQTRNEKLNSTTEQKIDEDNLEFCQLVSESGLSTVVQFKPLVVGDFYNGDNVISIFTSSANQDKESADEASETETATLHSGAGINGITAVDVNGKVIGVVNVSDVLSATMVKEDCVLVDKNDSENSMERIDFPSSAELSRLLANRLQQLQRADDTCTADYDSEPYLDQELPEGNPQEKIFAEDSDSSQLARNKRELIDRFANLIASANGEEIFEKVKNLCEPAMEAIESLLKLDVLQNLAG
ncbi:ZnF_C2H2 [Nesidiocoris tenuis]|uniref:ZnF_C2H2 n=1 Tax=Nesidiocoris tenuis TaxID=355587 RepID=A0ABN7BCG2_9HEMI|nr:ZnF_C2H2 [Nesidiocoris tenuis]